MMNSRHKNYADEIFDQSLSRIRQRISGLSQSRQLKTTTSQNTQSTKARYGGFTGRLEGLDRQCQRVLDDVTQLNLQKRTIRVRLEQLKEDLLGTLELEQISRRLGVNELRGLVKCGIEQSRDRNKRIEQSYYKNVEDSNKIKVSLVDLRNKINEIEHRLGCNATIWHKI